MKSTKMYKPKILYKMHILPLSEFRANASAMLDLVARGGRVRILRHGKPVADLVPVLDAAPYRPPHWKSRFEPLRLPAGVSLSRAVTDELLEGAA